MEAGQEKYRLRIGAIQQNGTLEVSLGRLLVLDPQIAKSGIRIRTGRCLIKGVPCSRFEVFECLSLAPALAEKPAIVVGDLRISWGQLDSPLEGSPCLGYFVEREMHDPQEVEGRRVSRIGRCGNERLFKGNRQIARLQLQGTQFGMRLGASLSRPCRYLLGDRRSCRAGVCAGASVRSGTTHKK